MKDFTFDLPQPSTSSSPCSGIGSTATAHWPGLPLFSTGYSPQTAGALGQFGVHPLGVAQLHPVGWIATILDDVVIVLFVVDRGWMILDRLTHQGWLRKAPQEEVTRPLQATPIPPPLWKESETGNSALSAPVRLSTPVPQRLHRGSLEVRARNTPRMRPINLKAFQDHTSADTAPHQICSECGRKRAYAYC